MESLFKAGDKVFLPKYGMKEWETADWAAEAGIPLNKCLLIYGVDDSSLRIKGYDFSHPKSKSKFRSISELYADINKVDLFDCDGMEFTADIASHKNVHGKIFIFN